MTAFVLAVLGLVAGIFVEGIVSSYHFNASFWPWPRCRQCGLLAVPAGLLDARCAGCGAERRARTLQVAVATALAFYLLGGQYWGHPLLLAVSALEAALLVAVLFIDLELRLIPTLLVGLLVALALGSAAAWPGLGVQSALLGAALGYLSFGAMVVLAHVVFGEGALGIGDANLALAIGCITGYPLVIFALSTGVFLGGLGAIALIAFGRHGLRSTMPYGPYLVLAVLYVLVRRNTMSLHFPL